MEKNRNRSLEVTINFSQIIIVDNFMLDKKDTYSLLTYLV